MAVSVSEFIANHMNDIKNMYGFDALMRDFQTVGGKKRFSISNDMIAKNLLSNNYGHSCAQELSLFFRKFAYANTEFVAGYK